jgi:hypothetical protein
MRGIADFLPDIILSFVAVEEGFQPLGLSASLRDFTSDITGSRLNTRLALPPRMFRFAVSLMNGKS